VPACPDYSGCDSSGSGDSGFFGDSGTKSNAGCGIRLDGASSPAALGGLGVLMALAMVRRRRQR
jgi:MYXO-CTERM domain-containing protein